MSEEDSNYEELSDSGTDGENIESDIHHIGVYPPPQNRVVELGERNKALQKSLQLSAWDLRSANRNISTFYYRLKESCKRLKEAYEQSQRKITDLQLDRWKLSKELTERGLEGLSLNEDNPKCSSGQIEAIFNDTVNSLKRQLEKSEKEKELVHQVLQAERAQWQNYCTDMHRRWTARELEFQQAQLSHRNEKEDHEKMIVTLKSQATMLLQDAEKDKQVLESTQESLKALQSQLQDKEHRILNLSRDIEAKENMLREKEGQMSSLRLDHEKTVTRINNENERSLEQLVKVYDEMREKNTHLDKLVKFHSEERDKIYAQYVCADESLKKKAEENNELRRKLEVEPSTEILSVYKERALIFQNDFLMEREARQKLHQDFDEMRRERDQCNNLVMQYQVEMQRLKQELMRCHQVIANRNGI